MTSASLPQKWTGRTRGGYLGNLIFVKMVKFFGLLPAYLLLFFVSFYFLFFAPRALRASLDYLKRRFGYSLPRRLLLSYCHFYSFGKILLDRLAIMEGASGRFQFAFEGEEHIREALSAGKGLVLLSAHVGAWEAAGHMLERIDVPVNVVMYQAEVERIKVVLEKAMAGRSFKPLIIKGSFEDSVEILAALRRGEIVAMLGDRATGGRTAELPFLGAEARFPIGPFAVAAVAGAPLINTFAARQGLYRYRLQAGPAVYPEFSGRQDRGRQLRQWMVEFIANLEQFLQRYPLQWHNFYFFWEAAKESQEEQLNDQG